MTAASIPHTAPHEGRRATFAALFLFSLILGFVGSLAVQLPNVRLHQLGVAGAAIGFSTALQALGIVIGAMLVVVTRARAGSAAIISLGAGVASASLLALGNPMDIAGVSAWRFAMAIGTGAVLTTAEYVLIARAPAGWRATAVAAFATFGIAGHAFAPAFIGLAGPDSERPLQIAAAGMLVVAILPWLTGIRTRIDPHDQPLRHLRLLLQTPLLFAPALAFGVIDGGFMELMNVYLMTRDLTVSSASTIAFCGVMGALLLQVPAGFASDRLGHARMYVAVWMVIIVSVSVIHFGDGFWRLAFAAFLLGGACDALYSIGFARLAGNVSPARLAAANGCFVATCGLGEICGPVIAGGWLHVRDGEGFTMALLLVAVIGVLIARRG